MRISELTAATMMILPFLTPALAALLRLTRLILPPPMRLALLAAWKIVPFLFYHLPLILDLAQSVVYGVAFWAIHCGGHVPKETYFASCVFHGILALLHRRPPG